jgi:signal recognition particle receptor subunit beta
MRTAKCPDNQGTPLLILANKQDLPNAKESKELEKLLGLVELLSPISLSVSSGTLSSIDGSIEKSIASSSSTVTSKNSDQNQLKTWHIQPTCAITGEGKRNIFYELQCFILHPSLYFRATRRIRPSLRHDNT